MNKNENCSSVIAHPVLERSASGLRHLRWAREILGTLHGFAAFPGAMSEAQREALGAEIERVTALVGALSAAVKPYRDFLERTRTLGRGRLRAAEHLMAGGGGLAGPLGRSETERAHADAAAELSGALRARRGELHSILAQAIDATRDGLRGMNERLMERFSPSFVAALYPPLTADRSRVQDDGDPDDDAAAGAAG